MATFFCFSTYMGVHWRHLANTTEPSVCRGDVAVCQITLTTSLAFGRPFVQQFSGCWDGRLFGHDRHRPKSGKGCCGAYQCGLPLYQLASWSIQPFGHNCRNATLLRV